MYVNVSTVSDASSEFKFNLRDVVWSESTDKIYKLIPATQNEWLESICISTFPRKELRHPAAEVILLLQQKSVPSGGKIGK